MKNPKSLKSNSGIRLVFSLCAVAAGLVLWTGHDAEAKVDAVSAASLSVRADSIKTTTVTIAYFNDRYNYGSRTLCYVVAPATPTTGTCVVKTASGNQGTFKVSGLIPFTSYNYSIKAINTRDTKDPTYTTSGSFKTLADTIPIDTIPIDTIPIDTIPIDTIPIDTIPIDTIPIDTIPIDTIPIDTIPIDTIPIDTIPIDTIPIDTIPIDTIPIDTTTSLRSPYHGMHFRNTEISESYDLQGRRIPAGRHTAPGPSVVKQAPERKRLMRKTDTP